MLHQGNLVERRPPSSAYEIHLHANLSAFSAISRLSIKSILGDNFGCTHNLELPKKQCSTKTESSINLSVPVH